MSFYPIRGSRNRRIKPDKRTVEKKACLSFAGKRNRVEGSKAIQDLDGLRVKDMNDNARDAYAKSIARFEKLIDTMKWKCSELPEWQNRIEELFPHEVKDFNT